MLINKTRPSTLSRRTMLRGAAGVAISLPFLEAMLARRAYAAAPPRRFLAYFLAEGTIIDQWMPTGTETEFKLSPILAPLEPHKSDLIIVKNLKAGGFAYGHSHACTSLTGFGAGTSPSKIEFDAGGPSVDQVMASRLKEKTRFASLQLGVALPPNSKENNSTISFAGPGKPIIPENNPYAIYERLFSGFTPPATASGADQLKMIRARKKSVIDYAKQDAARLQARLGAEDRGRLDSYLTSVRDIERQLDGATVPSGTSATCGPPKQEGPALAFNDAKLVPQLLKVQTDLAVAALACDLTRVIVLMADRAGSTRSQPWCDAAGDFHGISHDGTAAGVSKMVKIGVWWNQQFGYLLSRMKEVVEADGSRLLDNSLVMQVPEYGPNVPDKDSHEHARMPYLFAGKCGGAMKTGRFLTYPEKTYHNPMFVSILRAMGFDDLKFGDPDPKYNLPSGGPLPGF